MWSQEELSEPGRKIMSCHWFSALFLQQGLRNPVTAQRGASPLYGKILGVQRGSYGRADLTGMP